MENNINKYFGGTDICLEKLKELHPDMYIDGTTYQLEDWLKECEVFDKLIPDVSKVFIPYGGTLDYGILVEVVWNKLYINPEKVKYFWEDDIEEDLYPETRDWWIYEPYLKVRYNELEWYVYEVTYYKSWKRKSQMKYLAEQALKPKRKFLSKEDIREIKKQEMISNSQNKRLLISKYI